MSLGSECFLNPALDNLADWEEVVGSYGDVVKKCNELAEIGFKYSKGGYIKLEDGRYTRSMYLFLVEKNK